MLTLMQMFLIAGASEHKKESNMSLCSMRTLEEVMKKTIGAHAFYRIVKRHLKSTYPGISVVRMGDGERQIMLLGNSSERIESDINHDSNWLFRLGIEGMRRADAKDLLYQAASKCTFFAPNTNGLSIKGYSVYEFFPERNSYVDNFFVNSWTEEMILGLYRKAGHVLLLHNNAQTADSLQLRLQGNDIAKVDFLKLTKWQEAQEVLDKAKNSVAPLVLVSAGPGSKWIIPEIATGTSKVVLDIGNAIDHWLPQTLPVNRDKADKFCKRWVVL